MVLGVLGTGQVGRRIASKLVDLGHTVTLGSRTADNAAATAWAAETGGAHGTFRDAASGAEMVFNCTPGQHTLAVVESARDALAGTILVDLSNPLDFSGGFPPTLSVSNTDSLGEQVQRALPDTRVVKALNTVSNTLMTEPGRIEGDHVALICGDDASAKAAVTALLRTGFGWPQVLDLGDMTNARGTEAWLLLWTRIYRALGTGDFNLALRTVTP